MNYANYEESIVQARKVRIIGWPNNISFASPSTIGNLKDMTVLHDGWLAGSIRWVRMTAVEVKEHTVNLEQRRAEGEVIGKKRKRQSTVAKKNGQTTSKGKDGDLSDHNDKENDGPSKSTKTTKRTKRAPTSQMAPKSKVILTDTEDEMEHETEGAIQREV